MIDVKRLDCDLFHYIICMLKEVEMKFRKNFQNILIASLLMVLVVACGSNTDTTLEPVLPTDEAIGMVVT